MYVVPIPRCSQADTKVQVRCRATVELYVRHRVRKSPNCLIIKDILI